MGKKMPVLFIGHGSPMNALETNIFVQEWETIAKQIERPKGILSVSAHWVTDGVKVNDQGKPKIIYDMYGFPKEIYEIKYNAPGAPELARETMHLISAGASVDNNWGIDHGTWVVLRRMYPDADIPVFQLSIDSSASAEAHFKMGKELNSLREQGILILGSGNVVHNLMEIDFGMQGGYEWAETFDAYIKSKIMDRQFQDVVHHRSAGGASELAFRTPEHFYPLLYVLGASEADDRLTIFNDSCIFGSLSMTSYLFG